MTPEEVEAMNRASLVKNKGNAPSETSGGSQAPPVAGGGGVLSFYSHSNNELIEMLINKYIYMYIYIY